MTPVELRLSHELEVKRQRFSDEWLFRWHNINIEGRVVKVDDFKGGTIQVGGIVFDGQIREIYWLTVQRYLLREVHEVFGKWTEGSQSYPRVIRAESCERVGNLARQFAEAILVKAADTDRLLRGKGYPEKVLAYSTNREAIRVNAEIDAILRSFRVVDDGASEGGTTGPTLRDAVIFKPTIYGMGLDPSKLWRWVKKAVRRPR